MLVVRVNMANKDVESSLASLEATARAVTTNLGLMSEKLRFSYIKAVEIKLGWQLRPTICTDYESYSEEAERVLALSPSAGGPPSPFYPSQWTHVVYVFPSHPCVWAGKATNGSLTEKGVVYLLSKSQEIERASLHHELGHNFGARHSGDQKGNPYGDGTCTMGHPPAYRWTAYNPVKMFKLGLLEELDVLTLQLGTQKDQTFLLNRLHQVGASGGASGLPAYRVLRLLTQDSKDWFFANRNPGGIDNVQVVGPDVYRGGLVRYEPRELDPSVVFSSDSALLGQIGEFSCKPQPGRNGVCHEPKGQPDKGVCVFQVGKIRSAIKVVVDYAPYEKEHCKPEEDKAPDPEGSGRGPGKTPVAPEIPTNSCSSVVSAFYGLRSTGAISEQPPIEELVTSGLLTQLQPECLCEENRPAFLNGLKGVVDDLLEANLDNPGSPLFPVIQGALEGTSEGCLYAEVLRLMSVEHRVQEGSQSIVLGISGTQLEFELGVQHFVNPIHFGNVIPNFWFWTNGPSGGGGGGGGSPAIGGGGGGACQGSARITDYPTTSHLAPVGAITTNTLGVPLICVCDVGCGWRVML
jgi:hypothetical protein